MAYQKKVYRSVSKSTGRAQTRGGGETTRLNRPHRYPTRPVETPISPTFEAAKATKKLKV